MPISSAHTGLKKSVCATILSYPSDGRNSSPSAWRLPQLLPGPRASAALRGLASVPLHVTEHACPGRLACKMQAGGSLNENCGSIDVRCFSFVVCGFFFSSGATSDHARHSNAIEASDRYQHVVVTKW